MSGTNLVIQGEEIETRDLKDLAKRSGAQSIERISRTAFRLVGGRGADGIAEACERAALDWAEVPAHRRLADFGLAAMDMDSTLIAIECIDELAALRGVGAEVHAITEAAMRGEMDFRESLTRRVALLRGLPAGAMERVWDERLRLNPGAERLVAGFRRCGVRTLLVSGGFAFFTERLKARLGLDYAASNEVEVEDGCLTGRLTGEIVDAPGKAACLARVRDELGLAPAQTIAIGDGANDLPMMAAAGLSVAWHAKPVVRARATHAVSHAGLDGILNLFAA